MKVEWLMAHLENFKGRASFPADHDASVQLTPITLESWKMVLVNRVPGTRKRLKSQCLNVQWVNLHLVNTVSLKVHLWKTQSMNSFEISSLWDQSMSWKVCSRYSVGVSFGESIGSPWYD